VKSAIKNGVPMEERNFLRLMVLVIQFEIILILGGLAYLYAYLGQSQNVMVIVAGLFGYLSPQVITALTTRKD
jgi:hypothetical protein